MQAPSNDLLNKVKSGDREAFGELYTLYRQPCYSFALLILKSHEDAEDAVQNTFIRMHGSILTLKSDKAFIMWMETILNRECLRIVNRRGMEVDSGNVMDNDRISDPEQEFLLPEWYAERDDLAQRLKDEIEKLSFEQRRAILLFYYHNLTLQQIAELTDSNINTVKSRLRYARLTLKNNIEELEKQSGEKFYGVPLLPFGEILERILDREKERKKPAALWKALQKDIDAVCGSFGGNRFVGEGHAAKIVAGVLAAMLALGAAAGVLAGAVVPESGHGWSNMQGGRPEQNPEQIASTEPGTWPDDPIRNTDQNFFAPFRADDFAQNVLNTPQDPAENNNIQTPAVLPTQTVRNTPVFPTQANARPDDPVQPTTLPTPLPTRAAQDTQEQSGNAFQAYRDLLQRNEQAIRSYNWQYSDSSAPVTLADIYGDSTPELLYISADGNTARLNIYTYDGEKTVSLLSGSDGFRSESDVNDAFFFYQRSGDKRLYLYIASNSDYGTFRNIRFDESAGGLNAVELAAGRLYPSQYTVGGNTVSESVYTEFEKSQFNDISGILLRNDFRGMCSDEAYEALERYSPSALSLNDTLSYLEAQS